MKILCEISDDNGDNYADNSGHLDLLRLDHEARSNYRHLESNSEAVAQQKEAVDQQTEAMIRQQEAVNNTVSKQHGIINALVDKFANMRSRSESPERRTARPDGPVASEGAGAPTDGLPAQWNRSNPTHFYIGEAKMHVTNVLGAFGSSWKSFSVLSS